MTPIIYYGNALLSGSLFAMQGGDADTLSRVRDGSVNLSYVHTISGAGGRTGEVNLTLPFEVSPDAVVLPRCLLQSGTQVRVRARTVSGAVAKVQVNEILSGDVTFYLSDFDTPERKIDTFFEIRITAGASQPLAQEVHEVVLAQKYTLPRSPEVSVTRTRVRQFSRIPIPGGQPFVKRNGPMLRQTSMNFVVLSGSEVNALRGFIGVVEGGEAFTLSDDLGDVYWAELLDANVPEQDEAGVSRVSLTFQEIKVE